MSKPQSERTHKKRREAEKAGLRTSPEEALREKRSRWKASKAERQKVRREQAEERQRQWQSLSVEEQLASLDGRPGNSKKQRERLENA